MSRRLGAAFLYSALVTSAACGNKTSSATTTPTAGAGSASGSAANPTDPTSMNGSAAIPSVSAAGNDHSTSGGTPTPPASTPPANTVTSEGPPVVPPNLDTDPAQAKAQVDQLLAVAKQSLNQPTPDADAALRDAKQALTIDQTSIDAAAMVAFAYYHKHFYDAAELVLDDVFKRDAAKNNAMIYYVYGLVYDHTARPEKAVLAYKKAVELDPNFASAQVDLGVHQLQNKQYAEAEQTFESVVNKLGRADAITLTGLASAYRGHSGDYTAGDSNRDTLIQKAEATYKRAIQANPGYGPAFYDLGLLYLDADPFPGLADPVARLNAAKSYFDQYKNMQNVDMKLYDQRMKDVNKGLKNAQKKAKKADKPADKPADPPAGTAPKP